MRWSIAFLLFVSVASAADVLKPSTVTAPAAVPPVSTQTAAGAAVSTATVALTPQDKGLAAAYSVAAAYGVGKAHDIQAIAFNYNLQKGSAQIHREWKWDVADNRVEYRGPDASGKQISHTYRRDKLNKGDEALNKQVDQMFVQDQYWLLFPFHLTWEKRLKFEYDAARRMRIEPHTAECVTVTYPSGGPTGGDMYEVFFGPDHLIREWAYRPKGAADPAFVTTWERNAKAGPFLFSLARRSAGNKTFVWFDRVSVKILGTGWVDAAPIDPSVSLNPPTENPTKKGL